ncbi:hypothetical protein ACJX0J_029651, partial [Zea mays]
MAWARAFVMLSCCEPHGINLIFRNYILGLLGHLKGLALFFMLAQRFLVHITFGLNHKLAVIYNCYDIALKLWEIYLAKCCIHTTCRFSTMHAPREKNHGVTENQYLFGIEMHQLF